MILLSFPLMACAPLWGILVTRTTSNWWGFAAMVAFVGGVSLFRGSVDMLRDLESARLGQIQYKVRAREPWFNR